MNEAARRAAGILAQCKWLRDNISKWETQAKEVLSHELSGGERTKAIAADGTVIGAVTRAEGARSMSIDNEDGFLMWVKQRYPTEVVETVRPSFVKVCAEKVKTLGGLPDANGELCPHVSLSVAEPKATVSLGENDREIIEDLFMHRHMPEVMEQMEPQQIEARVLEFGDPRREVGTMPVDPTGPQPHGITQVSQDDSLEPEPVEPEPFIEEGPPNWAESNTFETSDAVRQRRR